MTVEILPSAYADLAAGRDFDEQSGAEAADHFLRSLFTDIASLSITDGSHRKQRSFHRLISKRSLTRCTIVCEVIASKSHASSIVASTRDVFGQS